MNLSSSKFDIYDSIKYRWDEERWGQLHENGSCEITKTWCLDAGIIIMG
jgi:hypothetical protein